MADPTAIIDDIGGGAYDGQLGDLLNAVFDRAAVTETSFGWRIRLGDDEWTMETVTLQELAFAERALSTGSVNVSYLQLDPIRSMDHLVALIVAHLHHVDGRRIADSFAEAAKLAVTDLEGLVSVYEVKGHPKADGGTTSTN